MQGSYSLNLCPKLSMHCQHQQISNGSQMVKAIWYQNLHPNMSSEAEKRKETLKETIQRKWVNKQYKTVSGLPLQSAGINKLHDGNVLKNTSFYPPILKAFGLV